MQRLDNTILTVEKEYATIFSEQDKKFCLNLHYNGGYYYLFFNGVKISKFNVTDSQLNAAPLCLFNVSKEFSADNVKNTKING